MQAFQRLSEPYMGKNAIIEKKKIFKNVETHWHEFYEFEFILSGECEFVINGKAHLAEAGDMFIFNLSDFHNINLVSSSLEVYTLQFASNYINDSMLSYLIQSNAKKLSFKGESLHKITCLLEEFCKECTSQLLFHDEYTKILLHEIIINTCRRIEESGNRSKVISTPLQLAMNFMQLHFQECIDMADVAEYALVSQSYLSRIFSHHLSMGPKKYLSKLRLSYAVKMLEFSELSVTDICYQSGFGDFSSFWRAFVEKYKCSPGEYRHNHRHGDI